MRHTLGLAQAFQNDGEQAIASFNAVLALRERTLGLAAPSRPPRGIISASRCCSLVVIAMQCPRRKGLPRPR